MKKTDARDELLHEALEHMVRSVDPDSEIHLSSIVLTGARRRAGRTVSMVMAILVFISGIGWASFQFRDHGVGVSQVGSLERDGFTLSVPQGWVVSAIGGCGFGSLRTGTVVSSVPFTFRNPSGGEPGCSDRLVLAGFPRDGVAVSLTPQGVIPSLFIPPATPFPLSLDLLRPTRGIEGGPKASYLSVVVDGEPRGLLNTFVGSESSTETRRALASVVHSIQILGASDWSSFHSERHDLTVQYPPGWTRAAQRLTPSLTDPLEILALGTYPLRVGGDTCAQFPVNAIEDLGPTDALIWLAERRGPTSGAESLPSSFELLTGSGEGDESPDCLSTPKDFWHRNVEFSEDGRVFELYLAHGNAATGSTSEMAGILDNLSLDASPDIGAPFVACPALSGTDPVTQSDAEQAVEAAHIFVVASNADNAGTLHELLDPAAEANGLAELKSTAEQPILDQGPGSDDPLVEAACGAEVASHTWWVVIDDGTASASLDTRLFLILRPDGWRVWAAY
jgi:hypothetical protein